MFAEHAKGQPFWSQAKAEDFRRNTPWADVYALPKASTAELLSEEKEIEKEQGEKKAEEFADAMGLPTTAENVISVLPLGPPVVGVDGTIVAAQIPVMSEEEAAKKEAEIGAGVAFIDPNTPITDTQGVVHAASDYLGDSPLTPMPGTPVKVTMPDNKEVILTVAPVEEQLKTETANEENGGETAPAAPEPIIESSPGKPAEERPIVAFEFVDGETKAAILEPTGLPATVTIEHTLQESPESLVGSPAKLEEPNQRPVDGVVSGVTDSEVPCVEGDGQEAKCAKVTLNFVDGTKLENVPVVIEEAKVGAIVISAHGQKETIEAQVTQSGEGATLMEGVDSTGKKITLEFRPSTNEKISEALKEDNPPGANGGQVDVTITDPSGNRLAETKAIISEVKISEDQREEDIRMGTDINGQHVEIVAQLPVEAPKENQPSEILQSEVTLPGEHVPQPATVLLPPAGVTEELRVRDSEIRIFEHGAGQPASGQIIPLGPMGQMAGPAVPFVQLGQDEARNNADGTVTTDQKFITQDGKTLEVMTLSTGPLNADPMPAPQ
jgi:hypothetical protein